MCCLSSLSLDIAAHFKNTGKELLANVGQRYNTRIEFTHGDTTDLEVKNWSDGDIIFANSTCFDDALMGSIAEKAARLKKGAIVITLTKKIPGPHFKVLEHQLYQMSWGGATVFISQKTTDPYIDEDEGDDNEP